MNSHDIAATAVAIAGFTFLTLTMRWLILDEEQNLDDEDQP